MLLVKQICTFTLQLFLVLFASNFSYGQAIKSNPIIYLEGFAGAAFGKTPGLFGGGELNYQYKSNLLTLRASGTTELKGTVVSIVFLPFPLVEQKTSSSEYALLYGYRIINNGESYSFSLGVSTNRFNQNIIDPNSQYYTIETNYIGVPYELNIKWFNKRKKPLYTFYGLIKASPPTAFSGSYGIKIAGNISPYSFVSCSLVLGIGWHKHY